MRPKTRPLTSCDPFAVSFGFASSAAFSPPGRWPRLHVLAAPATVLHAVNERTDKPNRATSSAFIGFLSLCEMWSRQLRCGYAGSVPAAMLQIQGLDRRFASRHASNTTARRRLRCGRVGLDRRPARITGKACSHGTVDYSARSSASRCSASISPQSVLTTARMGTPAAGPNLPAAIEEDDSHKHRDGVHLGARPCIQVMSPMPISAPVPTTAIAMRSTGGFPNARTSRGHTGGMTTPRGRMK